MVCNAHLVTAGYWKERDKYMIDEIPENVFKYEYQFSQKSINNNPLLVNLDAEELGRQMFNFVRASAASYLQLPKPCLVVLEGQCFWNEYTGKYEADIFISEKVAK